MFFEGNSWGTDENGNTGLGFGHQEEFYGCSDIAIGVNPPETVVPDGSGSSSLPRTMPTRLFSSSTRPPRTTTEWSSTVRTSRRPQPSKTPRPRPTQRTSTQSPMDDNQSK